MARRLLASSLCVLALLLLPALAHAQTFPPLADDVTTSLGSFQVSVSGSFAGMFIGCTGYDSTTHILKSPTLYDPATIVGRSNPGLDDGDRYLSPFRRGGAIVGTAENKIDYDMLIPPAGFPCYSDRTSCFAGPPGPPGTRQVITEIRSLKMTAGPIVVRAGQWYNDPNNPNFTPERRSPGRVVSRSGPSNDITRDFPASSFFDVYVRVDLPPCGTFPGATVNNLYPLIVKNDKLLQFPPRVVYLHDASSIVPIVFLADNLPAWHAGDVLGYFLLAGHGVGYGNSQSDMDAFNSIMNGQALSQCPFSNACKAQSAPAPAPALNPLPLPMPAANTRPGITQSGTGGGGGSAPQR